MEQRIILKRIDQILSHPVFREQFALLQESRKRPDLLPSHDGAFSGCGAADVYL